MHEPAVHDEAAVHESAALEAAALEAAALEAAALDGRRGGARGGGTQGGGVRESGAGGGGRGGRARSRRRRTRRRCTRLGYPLFRSFLLVAMRNGQITGCVRIRDRFLVMIVDCRVVMSHEVGSAVMRDGSKPHILLITHSGASRLWRGGQSATFTTCKGSDVHSRSCESTQSEGYRNLHTLLPPRAKSRLALAVPVHSVRMKIAHRGALGARLGRTSTPSLGAHLFLSMHTLIRLALSLRRTLLIPIVGAPLIVEEHPPACPRVTLTHERGLTATLAATRKSYACARGSPACNAGRALFHRAGVRGFAGERANADRNLSALCFFWRGSGSLSFCRCSLSTA